MTSEKRKPTKRKLTWVQAGIVAIIPTIANAKASLLVSATGVNASAFGAKNDRQREVVEAFQHGWQAYKENCWGKDELLPVSGRCSNEFGGLGAQLVDVLDTLLIMGLYHDYDKARSWIALNFTAAVDANVSLFETTIRILGGLMSAHFLTQDEELLRQATDLGSRLLRAWREGPIPYEQVNLVTGQVKSSEPALGSTLAEVGSLQIELMALSSATQDPRFMYRGEHVMNLLGSLLEQAGGLLPIMLHPDLPSRFTNMRVTLGGRGDSFYEYLLKRWLQTNRTEERYLLQYRTAVDGITKALVGHSSQSNLTFIREVDSHAELSPHLISEDAQQWTTTEHLKHVFSGQLVFFVALPDSASEEENPATEQRDRPDVGCKQDGSSNDMLEDASRDETCVAEGKEPGSAAAEKPEDDDEEQEEEFLPESHNGGGNDEGAELSQDTDQRSHLRRMMQLFSRKLGRENQMVMVLLPAMPGKDACSLAELISSKRWDQVLDIIQVVAPPGVHISGSLLDTIGTVAGGHLTKQCRKFGSFKMDHLACFLPGVLALGVWTGAAVDPLAELQLADRLCLSCVEMWRQSPSGLAADSTLFGTTDAAAPVEVLEEAPYSCIRPETIESLWYLYSITGDSRYQEMGWDIFQAIQRHARVERGGYSGIEDVTQVNRIRRRDRMETFVLSETFKYLFLLFAEEPLLDLDQVVLNTEGHILPVIDPRL